MKIIAKQGSELEKLLKQMNERLLREQDEAKDMIQEYCGSRPDSIGYVWAFGFTAEWFYTLIGFENKEFVPEKLIPNNDDKKHLCWKINKRKKEGREFIDKWCRKFRGIDGRPLNKLGIPVMHEETGRYFHWLPLEKDGVYYVSVGSSILECMPSANKPLEIELINEKRDFDNLEQSVNRDIYLVPLSYTSVEDGVKKIFDERKGKDMSY